MRHCDEYIDDPDAPEPLRTFLEWHRRPAIEQTGTRPTLFATYHGKICRVVMASRFGDVGIRFEELHKPDGYSLRCLIRDLRDFSVSLEEKP